MLDNVQNVSFFVKFIIFTIITLQQKNLKLVLDNRIPRKLQVCVIVKVNHKKTRVCKQLCTVC